MRCGSSFSTPSTFFFRSFNAPDFLLFPFLFFYHHSSSLFPSIPHLSSPASILISFPFHLPLSLPLDSGVAEAGQAGFQLALMKTFPPALSVGHPRDSARALGLTN